MPVEFKDYYRILGVPRDASDEVIKKAFRKLARRYHPDVAKDKKAAEERFKEINEAYDVLGDPAKRKKYDRLGAGWQTGAGKGPESSRHDEFHFGGTGFSDFFEQFFGGGRHASFEDFLRHGGDPARAGRGFESAAFAQRGSDVEGDILVSLDEVMHGSVRSVSLQPVNPHTGQTEMRRFKVRIPAGVQEGQAIRVPGKGGGGSGGGLPGDLYLRVRYAAHPDFYPRGADLDHELDLAPWEAVLGTTAEVPAPGGRVSVRIPPGTNQGQKLRLRGRGLPRGPRGPRGDLYVVVHVQLPQHLTAEERVLWEKLARVSRFHPRSTA